MKQADKLRDSAKKKLKKKDKKGAMYDLKRKKLLEKELAGIQNKKLNLDTQKLALENAQMNAAVFTAVKTGASALKVATKNTNVDDVDEVMDELAELGDEQEAVNEALGQPLEDFDDDELLAELDGFEAE